jgi:hypothetical protein
MFEMFNGDSITAVQIVGRKLKMPEPDDGAIQSTKVT